MNKTSQEIIDKAYEIYMGMHQKIKDMYAESENFLILNRPTEEEIYYDAEEYIQQILKNIAFVHKDLQNEEEAFIKKIKLIGDRNKQEINANEIVESVTNAVPEYLKLAKEVDDNTGTTKYAKELLEMTEELYRKIQTIDGESHNSESELANNVIDKLKEYLKTSVK